MAIAQSDLGRCAAQAKNLVQMFEAMTARRGNAVAVKAKKNGAWQDTTFEELARRARDVSDGLAALGVRKGDRVAIIGETTAEWILADVGIMGASAIAVPIYQSNLAHDVAYILENSGATWIFCDTEAQAAKVREIKDRLPALKGVIRTLSKADGPFERDLADLERAGAEWRRSNERAHVERVTSITLDDPASFLYTSGTTGNPKGVVLTHGNWVYEAHAVEEVQIITGDDLVLMFLPMAHSFAKVIEAVWFAVGCQVAFVESLDKIVDNAGEVRPTVMPAVPRIFEKAFSAVVSKGYASPGLKGSLFKLAMESFESWVAAKEQGKSYASLGFAVGRKLVFPKLSHALSARFGGRMRLFVSGGAPLSPKIAWFFNLLGFTILEGYGLTETSAATCVNRVGQNRIGTVGPPVPGTRIRIAEDGEILVKGGGVMKGYHGNPAATEEVLKDGWFATGDIGFLDEAGHLKITDRKKDIIVTAGGKNVAPQNLENELKATCQLISQVMVHGDQRKFLSALVTLNEENARKWAADNGVHVSAMATNAQLKAELQKAVDQVNAKQASYSTIKRWEILPKDFTIESGELTPTLKVKRKVITQKHRQLLDSFYDE